MSPISIIPIPGFSEPVSCWSHLLASATFFLFSVILIYRGRGNSLRVSSLFIYGFCTVYLFSMSGVYHLLEPGGLPRAVLQRLDHSGIWAMIAGTFTPIHIILFRGVARWLVLFVVWSIAISGLTLEVVFFDTFPEWLSLSLYLVMGWLGAGTWWLYKEIYQDNLHKYLVWGGLAYSVGGVCEFLRWPELYPGVVGPHEVFHFMVVIAASFHATFIFLIAPLYITKRLTIKLKIRESGEIFAVSDTENFRIKIKNEGRVRQDISDTLRQKYKEPYLPSLVRIKKEQELYLCPSDPDDNSKDGDDFYGKEVIRMPQQERLGTIRSKAYLNSPEKT